ncbi:MAG TPA: hypothetical protein VFF30_05810 [Nitrososphaerales archaeon]|nr:hypothetical protein [Nitrososphaerales archaeon]
MNDEILARAARALKEIEQTRARLRELDSRLSVEVGRNGSSAERA